MFKRGGGVTGKKKNIIQKLRKKFLPTFGEQFDKAKKEGEAGTRGVEGGWQVAGGAVE